MTYYESAHQALQKILNSSFVNRIKEMKLDDVIHNLDEFGNKLVTSPTDPVFFKNLAVLGASIGVAATLATNFPALLFIMPLATVLTPPLIGFAAKFTSASIAIAKIVAESTYSTFEYIQKHKSSEAEDLLRG